MNSFLIDTVRLLRPHQWVKNLLVLVPALTSHQLFQSSIWLPLAELFFAQCLLSSAIYVVNDALDAPADRLHPDKCARPFARGALPIGAVAWLFPLLLAGASILAWLLPAPARLVLLIYGAVALSYSFVLKRLLWLDVLVLAMLYTLRVLAGAFAIAVPPSEWLLAFAMFVFVGLAALKRYAEVRAPGAIALPRRAYRSEDAPVILALGAGSSVAAVLVMALYINSPDMHSLYRNPVWLWPVCGLLWYWLARAWTLAHRGELRSDPVLFALRDPASLILAAALLLLIALAA